MKIYDVPQLSTMLQVSPKTVRSYLATGKLQGRKVGKRWLVAESALERFLLLDGDSTRMPANAQAVSALGQSHGGPEAPVDRPDIHRPR